MILIIIGIIPIQGPSYGWGQTGHRIAGAIADNHLNKKTRNEVERVLQGASLAMVGNHMDFIKSEPAYDHLKPWHYATIPDGKTYEEAGTPEEKDVIWGIQTLVKELKTKNFSQGDEAFTLMCLIHLVEDIHQPLHVGNGNDHGGNDVKVFFFGSRSNLHRVWDSEMIDQQQLAYSEYAAHLDTLADETIEEWQNATVLDWAYESMRFREQTYRFPDDGKLSYRYTYDHLDLIHLRLQQAGIRLAGILNEIYGN